MSEEVADVLDSAANWLDKHDWVQGVLFSGENSACMVGATFLVEKDATRRVLAQERLGNYLVSTPAIWNDQPGRTKQEVLDALRGAAKQERG